MLLFVIAFAVVATLLLFVFKFQALSYWSKRRIPGPSPTFLFGNTPNAILKRRNVVHDYDSVYKNFKDHQLVGIFEIGRPNLLAISPAIVEQVLCQKFESFPNNDSRTVKHVLLSRDPANLRGAEWKKVRSEIEPAFAKNRMAACYPMVQEVCNEFTNYLKLHKHALELKEVSTKYYIDVIANTIFATDAGALTTWSCPIRKMAKKLIQPTLLGALLPIPSKVENLFTQLLAKALDAPTAKQSGYLEYLTQLKSKQGVGVQELTAHACAFFSSGMENTCILLSFILFELSRNTEIQTRLRAEINQAPEISFDTIHGMQYLDQIVNETLRRHTPTVTLKKISTVPVEMTIDDNQRVTIEKSTPVIVPVQSIHMDPQHYNNPKVFDPDRFAPENGGIDHFVKKGVFLAFGTGPRTCLGKSFAQLVVKSAVVEVVKNFRVIQSAETKLPLEMTSNNSINIPIGGVWAVFRPI